MLPSESSHSIILYPIIESSLISCRPTMWFKVIAENIIYIQWILCIPKLKKQRSNVYWSPFRTRLVYPTGKLLIISINRKIASFPNVSFNEYYGFFILTTYVKFKFKLYRWNFNRQMWIMITMICILSMPWAIHSICSSWPIQGTTNKSQPRTHHSNPYKKSN